MKKLLKLLAILIIFIIVIYGFLSIWVNIKGKKILEGFLTKKLGKDVKIRSVYVSPFFSFNIADFSFENCSAKKIVVEPFWDVLKGRFLLGRIVLIAPQIVFIKSEKKWISPFDGLKAAPKPSTAAGLSGINAKKVKKPLFLGRVKVKNGKIILKPENSKEEVYLDNININFDIPNIFQWDKRKIIIQSDLKIKGQTIKKDIVFSGWIDFLKKSMRAKLAVKHIPYHRISFLMPYFLRPEFIGLEDADFSLDADFSALNNDLTIDCYWNLLSYKLAPQKDQSLAGGVVSQSLLSIFEEKGKRVPFHCRIKTRFDKPKIDFTQIGNQALAKMGSITFTVGKQVVKEGVNTTKEVTTKAVKTAVSTVKTAVDIPKKVLETVVDTVGSKEKSK